MRNKKKEEEIFGIEYHGIDRESQEEKAIKVN
mgnify:FL=1